MSEKIRLKCTKTTWCTSLSRHLLEANARAGGIAPVTIGAFTPKGVKERCIGVAVKKNSKDKGVMLNFCPFCGKDALRLNKAERDGAEVSVFNKF